MSSPSPPSSTRRVARTLRYLLLALVLLGLLLMAWWPTALTVDHAPVQVGVVRASFEAEGRTHVRERYVIAAPVAALADRLGLVPGDPVQVGQPLVTLRAPASPALDARTRAQIRAEAAAAQANLQTAEAEAAVAATTLAQAQADAQRQATLGEQGMSPRDAQERSVRALEQARLQQRAAQSRVISARQAAQAAQARLQVGGMAGEQVLLLRSPLDGVVLRRHFESARPVQTGDPLIEVGDPHALEVEVDVLSSDAVRLSPGMAVELLRWGGAPTLQGVVRRIEPTAFTKVSALGVDEQRVWVYVDIRTPASQWASLGEAYRVQARFILQASDAQAMHVPSSAVFRDERGQAVFRIVRGRARHVPVETGMEGEGRTEIRSGLQAGDEVVVHPPRELTEGARVITP